MSQQVEQITRGVFTFRRVLREHTHKLNTPVQGHTHLRSWLNKTHRFEIWTPIVLHPTDAPAICQPCQEGPRTGCGWSTCNRCTRFFGTEHTVGTLYVHVQKIDEGDTYHGQATKPWNTYEWLKTKRPRTFAVPELIYYAESHGFLCAITSTAQGRDLHEALAGILGQVEGLEEYGAFPDSVDPEKAAEAKRLCSRVARQVEKAMREMSEWRQPDGFVCGVDDKPTPDYILSARCRLSPDTEHPYKLREPLHTVSRTKHNLRNFNQGCYNTCFGPGRVRATDIVLDAACNFVGFSHLAFAGYAPSNWVQLANIWPGDAAGAGLDLWDVTCTLPGRDLIPERESIRMVWSDALGERLDHMGFPRIDPSELSCFLGHPSRRLALQQTGSLKEVEKAIE